MISIVIIVKNDKRIEKLLYRLATMKFSEEAEIIVVDASEGNLDAIKGKFPLVRWKYFQNITNKKITIPEQRNTGIEHARGDVIVFIDSDCLPDINWFDELIKPIREEKELIVAGRVLLSNTNSLHAIEFEKNNTIHYVGEAPTMNIAIKKELFDKLGMFDENFQCGEDVDFCWRATEAGYNIRFSDKAMIYHDLGTIKNEIKRMYVYGNARVQLYKKHTRRRKMFIGNELLSILYPLYIIFLPITFSFHLYPLLLLFPIGKYIQKNPANIILMKSMYGTGVLRALILPN